MTSIPFIRPTVVGSFPLDVDKERYSKGATDLEDGIRSDDAEYFIKEHNDSFRQVLEVLGPDIGVPCYVQSALPGRNMINQFLDPIVRKGEGLTKIGELYLWKGDDIALSKEDAQIAEMIALKEGAAEICDSLGIDRIKYKACITGPFELMRELRRGFGLGAGYDEKSIHGLSGVLRGFFQNAYVETEDLKPEVITLDEPSIGLKEIGDFFIDSPTDHRLNHLISCLNTIYEGVPKECFRGLHLHVSPYNELSRADWNLLEPHVGFFVSKKWLEQNDKFVRAAVMETSGPTIPDDADPKSAWAEIGLGSYEKYLQPVEEMTKNLEDSIKHYGVGRIPFAGPECGFGPWSWNFGKEMAISNLRSMVQIIRQVA